MNPAAVVSVNYFISCARVYTSGYATRFFSGYVTTYGSIAGRSARELAPALGFSVGALRHGYLVYELLSPVELGDFEWRGQTKDSAGWRLDRSINEYVPVRDLLRASLGKRSNWSESATDAMLQRSKEEQRKRLNVRVGSERIVKVVPKARISAFPESPVRGLPQWELKVGKLFRLVADYGAACP